MAKKLSILDLRVGLMTLVAIGVLIATILTISGDLNPFRRELTVRTRLANVDGLRPGAEVRLAGVKVGKVQRIVLLPVPPGPECRPDRGAGTRTRSGH